jgi:PKD
MNILSKIGLMAVLVLSMVGCVDKTPEYGNFPGKDVDFVYSIDGDQFPLDFYVVSTIQFTNISEKTGPITWDFGDGTTSNESSPKHKYQTAGLYQVTLTIDGVGSRTYPLAINDIVPVLSIAKQSADVLVINDVSIEMSLFLPNPDNLVTRYEWTFPDGTTKEDGTVISSFTGYSHEDGSIDYPGALKFKNIGSQKIEIKTWFDINGENRRLEDSYVNVQVGCSYPCKTLYYAVLDGNINAYKLADLSRLPEGTKILPFDMGVKSGSMAQQMVLSNGVVSEDGSIQDDIFILDAGKQYTYINDEAGTNGDGKITVMSADGLSVNTMVTNVGQAAFDDPFQGCADDTYLYYTDRNLGVRKRPLTDRGAKESNASDTYLVQNNWLAYYGKGISYGAIHTGILLDSKGVFWWAKSYSGNGIYRFRTSDINKTSISFPIVLSGSNPKAFTIDEARKMMYVWMFKGTPGAGFVAYDLPDEDKGGDAAKYVKFIAMDADPINNTADEGVYVSQFALDNSTGNVYFGFRKSPTDTQGKYATGLYYYAPGASDVKKIDNVNDKILGIVINERETELF